MIKQGPYSPDSIRKGIQTLRGSKSPIRPREPLDIPMGERQMVMSRVVMEDYFDCRRTVHAVAKHEANPLISAEAPWETGKTVGASTVMYDENMGKFRIWGTLVDRSKDKKSMDFVRPNYFESSDGLHWERPVLRQVEYEGSLENNLLGYDLAGLGLIQTRSPQVFRLPSEHTDKGRFGMVVHAIRMGAIPDDDHAMEQYLAFSEDGLYWKLREDHNPFFHSRNDTPDQCIVWNPKRMVFMHYRRMTINAKEIRRIGYTESPELIEWDQLRLVIGPDELDPLMFYGMAVNRYQNMYLGLLHNFYVSPDENIKIDKEMQVDVQLAWSHDGISWERHPERPIFIPTGPIRPNTPDWGMTWGNAEIMDVGEAVYVYYNGCEGWHTNVLPAKAYHLCLGTLRRDGFVSLDSAREGWALTAPLLCPGGRLHINGKTEQDGLIQAAVREGEGIRDGEWSEDYSFDHADTFSGDSLNHALGWMGKEDLAFWKGKTIRLEFRLLKASLFSFWFE